MTIQRIKMMVSIAWVITVIAVGIAMDVSGATTVAVAAFGFLPPLALLLLWNDPSQTMSESINRARR